MFDIYDPKEASETKLKTYDVEISYAGGWISLEDDYRFSVHAESFAQRQKSHRQIKTTSPVVAGDFLVHSVPDMVTETVRVWVKGVDQLELADNLEFLEDLFDQFSFGVRITKDEYRETMTCQQASAIVTEGGHVYAHNAMGLMTATFARYPKMTREKL